MNVVEVVSVPVEIAADLANGVIQPVADLAKELRDEVQELTK